MKSCASVAPKVTAGTAVRFPLDNGLVGSPARRRQLPRATTGPEYALVLATRATLRAPYKQTWQMNLSTIIQPCNNTGYTNAGRSRGRVSS